MHGESIAFYEFLGFLIGGGALFLIIMKVLISFKKAPKQKPEIRGEEAISMSRDLEIPTSPLPPDISSILSEVMEKIPRSPKEASPVDTQQLPYTDSEL